MRYKVFGKTKEKISELTIGTWAIGGADWGKVDKNESIKAIQAMIDNGVNNIDTAPAYNFGEAERVVGEALKGRKRDEVFITTKTGVYNTKDVPYVKDARKETVYKLCEESLKNLQTDYIDLLLIHWPDIEHNAPFDETMDALNALKKEGKIRYIGLSNFDQGQIEDISQYGEIVALQPLYSMVDRSNENLMKWCYEHEIANMTYGSLGSGILTGKFREKPKFEENDTRNSFYSDLYEEPKFSKIQELLKTLDVIAENHGRPVSQVAINWSTQKDFVQTAICGVKNVKQANENCATFDWELTEEEIAVIDNKIEELGL